MYSLIYHTGFQRSERNMTDHLEEWKNIIQWYKEEHKQTEAIKYRIECIEELITSLDITKDKELSHFK